VAAYDEGRADGRSISNVGGAVVGAVVVAAIGRVGGPPR
jgi:hypothetical protein